MKVVALVSGGKDSCFSMLLCQQHGHEIVALANLCPAAGAPDELDSFMFQTIGHQLVAAFAACVELPLYRRRIGGASKHTELGYERTAGDEVEDLYTLLAFVKQTLPGVEAVASGAIASDYQRLRVEHVCGRLGLVSLAYLWHQPQAALLEGMMARGLVAVLVKVAALGLDPGRHLGRSIASMRPHLTKLRRQFGCSVCGEGGEYETFTLDCPMFPHMRIVLDTWEVAAHAPGDIAAALHPIAFHTERKPSAQAAGDGSPAGALDADGPRLNGRSEDGSAAVIDTQAALHAALRAIQAELAPLSMRLGNGLLVQLYLADLSHFAAANAAYACHFGSGSPPARACVQVPLPAGTAVAVDVLLPPASACGPAKRGVLHVQSVSAWAPACIGPYAQATVAGGLLHMAGQIGLAPVSMQLVQGGATAQAARCLSSCRAVAVALRCDLTSAMLACTIYAAASPGDAPPQSSTAACSLARSGERAAPLLTYAAVPALPRGAEVEFQPTALVDSSRPDKKQMQAPLVSAAALSAFALAVAPAAQAATAAFQLAEGEPFIVSLGWGALAASFSFSLAAVVWGRSGM
ncbi:hypothetical protein WJX81_008556 [Elliptochloris bilobata]|uniref:Diphthine--ammonia ligase n=1 Tax=Elliptochloris bilobata TaxID=381761 RepID=A0AAW1R1I5_9CHLO